MTAKFLYRFYALISVAKETLCSSFSDFIPALHYSIKILWQQNVFCQCVALKYLLFEMLFIIICDTDVLLNAGKNTLQLQQFGSTAP